MGLFGRKRRRDSRAATTPSAIRAALQELDMFMQASLLLVDRRLLEQEATSRAARWYLIGAAEKLARRRHLDRDAFLSAALVGSVNLKVPVAEVDDWLRAARSVGQRAPGDSASPEREALDEGSSVLEQWLSGQDNNSPMRLSQLVHEWRESR